MNRILITGGAGFIGSHLCNKLISEGEDVTCLDNLFTGSLENIQNLFDYDNFHFVEHDIIHPYYGVFDQIYNLACPASPYHYQYDPIKTSKSCYLGALNMLGLAKKTNARILQASTSEIYGDPVFHPQKETYHGYVNPIGIRSCYDEGKRIAETLFFDYYRMHAVNIIVMRIFNTYGPNMQINDGRVVSNFIVQALKNEVITIYGNGEQSRSFCYIDDLVAGLILGMNDSRNLTGPVNIGNPNDISIKVLAEKIVSLIGSSSKTVYHPLPQDDPVRRKPDISKIQNEFGWLPSVDLEDGLQQTIKYFSNRIFI